MLIALDHLRRMLISPQGRFSEIYYVGSEPLDGTARVSMCWWRCRVPQPAAGTSSVTRSPSSAGTLRLKTTSMSARSGLRSYLTLAGESSQES